MALQSMTGFARTSGRLDDGSAFAWELRSVNARSLDLRLRLPAGLEGLEPACRKAAGARFSRGTLSAGLTLDGAPAARVSVNEAVLARMVEVIGTLRERLGSPPPAAEAVLALRGVVELEEPGLDEEARGAREAALLAGFMAALDALEAARLEEGAALTGVLRGQIDGLAEAAARVETDPSRTPAALRERLERQLADLLGASPAAALDPARLHAEAALLATRADLREELDRLTAHLASARAMLAGDGPAGRRLDFLAQELNREANTLCAKSVSPAVTSAGLDMKVLVDQFREQVQNIE